MYEVTQKAVKNNNCDVVQVSYCGLQDLLVYIGCHKYNAGTYGWNCDIYEVRSYAITTGYRPFGNIKVNYELEHKYNELAKQLITGHDYITNCEKATNLLYKFICESRQLNKRR